MTPIMHLEPSSCQVAASVRSGHPSMVSSSNLSRAYSKGIRPKTVSSSVSRVIHHPATPFETGPNGGLRTGGIVLRHTQDDSTGHSLYMERAGRVLAVAARQMGNRYAGSPSTTCGRLRTSSSGAARPIDRHCPRCDRHSPRTSVHCAGRTYPPGDVSGSAVTRSLLPGAPPDPKERLSHHHLQKK